MASANSKGKGKSNKKERWTDNELNIFSDETNQFCSTLRKLVLKKVAINEVVKLTNLSK